jgi:hypothetical protein
MSATKAGRADGRTQDYVAYAGERGQPEVTVEERERTPTAAERWRGGSGVVGCAIVMS